MEIRFSGMKTIVRMLLLLLLGGVLGQAHAQSATPDLPAAASAAPLFRFGVDAALDLHILGWDKQYGNAYKPCVGFSTHGWGSMRMGNKWALQVGLGYALRRAALVLDSMVFSSDINQQSGVVSYSSMDIDFLYHDLQMPILLKYYFKPQRQGIYLGVGPQLNLLIAMRSKGTIRYGNGMVDTFTNNYRSDPANIGLQACIGRVFHFGPSTQLDIELYGMRYSGMLGYAPARAYTTGLRASYWF